MSDDRDRTDDQAGKRYVGDNLLLEGAATSVHAALVAQIAETNHLHTCVEDLKGGQKEVLKTLVAQDARLTRIEGKLEAATLWALGAAVTCVGTLITALGVVLWSVLTHPHGFAP